MSSIKSKDRYARLVRSMKRYDRAVREEALAQKQFRQEIVRVLRNPPISLYQIAKRLNVTWPMLYNIKNGAQPCSVEFAGKILKVLR